MEKVCRSADYEFKKTRSIEVQKNGAKFECTATDHAYLEGTLHVFWPCCTGLGPRIVSEVGFEIVAVDACVVVVHLIDHG